MTRRPRSEGPLNLVPVMNLVTILIPFLLLSAQFVAVAVIESTLPAIGPEDGDPPEPSLSLNVGITTSGFTLSGDGTEVLDEAERQVPCRATPCLQAADWDYETLARRCRALGEAWPDSDTVIVVPEGNVPYEALVMTMDATRGTRDAPLFPAVVVAGGMN